MRPVLYICLFLVFTRCDAYAQYVVPKQRITSVVVYTYNNDELVDRDSVRFAYSGGRVSDFDPYDFSPIGTYNNCGFNYKYDVFAAIQAELSAPLYNEGKLKVQFDVCEVYRAEQTPAYNLKEQHFTEFIDIDVRNYELREPYHRILQITNRNADGLPQNIYQLQYDSTRKKWDTTGTRKIYFDSDSRVIGDSSVTTDMWQATYEYDKQDRITDYYGYALIVGKQQVIRHNKYIYDRNEKLEKYIIRQFSLFNPGVLDTSSVLLIKYDDKEQIGQLINYGKSTNSVDLQTHRNYRYDQYGNLDSLITYTASNTYRTKFYFNSANNPDSAITSVAANGGSMPYPTRHKVYYTYETYIPDSPSTLPLVVFPNPARDHFIVRWNKEQPKVPMYVLLYSRDGRMVKKEYLPQTHRQDRIDCSELTDGVYFIRLLTANGGLLYTTTLCILH